MQIILYRRSLDFNSGAGQLISMQVKGLRAAGHEVQLACQRGAMRYFLQSGLRASRITRNGIDRFRSMPDRWIVDHGMELPEANTVFSHNLMTEAAVYLQRPEVAAAADRERSFFDKLNASALVVANSQLVKQAILERFGLPELRLSVCYPGYQSEIFNLQQRERLRDAARSQLGVGNDVPLVGFVTSGDLHKRGFANFLDAATAILAANPRARFLIVGSKQLPSWANSHPLLASGALIHRPKGRSPARWMSALDVFLYPARFEEFGMVVIEACALGVPVLTSRRVGASEVLTSEYDRWICDDPDAIQLAERALELLDNPTLQASLADAGLQSVTPLGGDHYAQRSVELICNQRSRCLV